MKYIYLGLGTNIGDRYNNLKRSITAISKICTIIDISNIYETKAWGFEDQADFLNMCISIKTDLDPEELLKSIKEIERNLGRETTFRWGPRVIDIDIIIYQDLELDSDNLIIPHPGITDRIFVLKPLNDIASSIKHPILQKTVGELLNSIDNKGISLFNKKILL